MDPLALYEALRAEPESPLLWARLRQALGQQHRRLAELELYPRLLTQALRIRGAGGMEPAAGEVIDALLPVVGASRGFIGRSTGDGSWALVAARGVDGDLSDPEQNISHTLIREALQQDQPVVFRDAARQVRENKSRSVHRLRLRAVAVLPFSIAGDRGFVYLDNPRASGIFDEDSLDLVTAWLPLLAQLTEPQTTAEHIPFGRYLTRSSVLRSRLAELERVAAFDIPVLVYGETGTGKSFLAECLHQASARGSGPFVHLNCSALPADLIESELFGSVRGAFTGATERAGAFESAQDGTLFLDELDLMPVHCQAKLLVAVQKRQITRLGDNRAIDVDVRIVSAMSSEPRQAVEAGRLREELFYRLAVLATEVPPLRHRPEDIPLLAAEALRRSCRLFGLPDARLSPEALHRLSQHGWPGNVRELENIIDRAAVLCRDGLITVEDLRLTPAATAGRRRRAKRAMVGREEFLAAWTDAAGDFDRAAAALGIHPRSIYRLLKKFEV